MLVQLDMARIVDWNTFHDSFTQVFGFPNYYGRNMNAWIDCMTHLDDADAGMTSVHISPGGVVTLQLENVDDFCLRCPEQYEAIIDCAAFVNWRRIQVDEGPILILSFHKAVSIA